MTALWVSILGCGSSELDRCLGLPVLAKVLLDPPQGWQLLMPRSAGKSAMQPRSSMATGCCRGTPWLLSHSDELVMRVGELPRPKFLAENAESHVSVKMVWGCYNQL